MFLDMFISSSTVNRVHDIQLVSWVYNVDNVDCKGYCFIRIFQLESQSSDYRERYRNIQKLNIHWSCCIKLDDVVATSKYFRQSHTNALPLIIIRVKSIPLYDVISMTKYFLWWKIDHNISIERHLQIYQLMFSSINSMTITRKCDISQSN